MTRLALLLTAAVALTTATGCTDSDDDEPTPITAALVAPLSGPAETSGREIRNAAELALEQERASGNPLAERFSFRFVDSQSDPEVSRADYQAAIDDPSVQLAFFNWHSNVALEFSQMASAASFPHLFALGATNELNQQFAADPASYAGTWFKGWPSPELLSVNYVTAIDEAEQSGSFDPGSKVAVVYGEDTSWGRTFGGAIRSQLESAGWTVALEVYVPADALDYTMDLEAVVQAEPTLLAGTIASSSIYNWIQQTRSEFDGAQLAQPLVVADGLGWNGDWYETLGATSDGVVDQIPQFVSDDAIAFRDAYEAQYGEAPSPSAAGLSYDYTKFMLKVLAEVEATQGEITREGIIAVAKERIATGQLTYDEGILMGSYRYSADSWPDPVVGGDAFTFPVLQYTGGDSVVVYPESLAGDNAISN